jgi:hypothetical protein
MIKTILLATMICLALFVSCKVSEKDFPGSYSLERFPKTILTIKSDNTFEFSKNNPNPYLHPFDHPSENYCITKGSWEKIKHNVITLTSQSDSLIYPLFEIKSTAPREQDISYFTFYDTFGDTVRLLYTQLSDGAWMGRLHGTSPYTALDLTKRDTFEFHFYGYRPVNFISGQRKNMDYHITLKPEFQPNFFDKTAFRIKKKKIIDIERNGRFQKTKRGV